jgi:hypothetical protein
MRRLRWAVPLAALLSTLAVAPASQAAGELRLGEYRIGADATERIRDRWVDRLLATHGEGTWAPARLELTDADLKDMGLPARRHLLGKRFPVPTAVYPDGRMVRLAGGGGKPGSGGSGGGTSSAGPVVTSFAGAGYFGIRPGAWLLTVTGSSIGWCSLAHVYGTRGSYTVSTAGHCGKTGDIGTVIGVVGNRPGVPVLMDFGKYIKSTGDGGIGRDHAMLSINAPYQAITTPTMAFWGGPKGVYTKTGDVVAANLFGSKGPTFSTNPDPFLAQGIVHYGHGTGVGAGGTPRAGAAITWRTNYFTFFGAISPGDSGSGSNTVTGDSVPAVYEAAGINTHIYVDPSLRTGVGLMAGTRTTLVGTPANGSYVGQPVPTPFDLP